MQQRGRGRRESARAAKGDAQKHGELDAPFAHAFAGARGAGCARDGPLREGKAGPKAKAQGPYDLEIAAFAAMAPRPLSVKDVLDMAEPRTGWSPDSCCGRCPSGTPSAFGPSRRCGSGGASRSSSRCTRRTSTPSRSWQEHRQKDAGVGGRHLSDSVSHLRAFTEIIEQAVNDRRTVVVMLARAMLKLQEGPRDLHRGLRRRLHEHVLAQPDRLHRAHDSVH
ncbi:unnamed protein product [Prorocentrum cordatum]|uniref:Uncharacterized protein n=1 Tax=Prorocentrum cordatum TaxID=2364126 RepID=A0ABN9VK95_9DINO|nr:unnamed protein product [Polarella glacialis]